MIKATLLSLLLLLSLPAPARKQSLRLRTDRRELAADTLRCGSFLVSSQCETCNNGYRLDQVEFSGFDKPAASSLESFFITNNTDRTLSGVSLYIEYLSPEGRQLHKRFLRLDCNIPPGQTRRAEIKSFDTQRSYHYRSSAPSRHSDPFRVLFDPISYYLRF